MQPKVGVHHVPQKTKFTGEASSGADKEFSAPATMKAVLSIFEHVRRSAWVLLCAHLSHVWFIDKKGKVGEGMRTLRWIPVVHDAAHIRRAAAYPTAEAPRRRISSTRPP